MTNHQDSFWLRIIYIVSITISLAVAFLILGPRPEGMEGLLDVSGLPLVNATLNSITTLLLILGFYFGSEKLLNRYSFLKYEIFQYIPSLNDNTFSRAEIAKFALLESRKFILFGYGGGGFENLFKINFKDLSTDYASHAHSDLIEFIGEFGLIGFVLILVSLLSLFFNKNFFLFKNFLLCYLIIFILIFDFSLHIPIIQVLFILLLSISYNQKNNLKYKIKD
mgnify:CR=1 FL=1